MRAHAYHAIHAQSIEIRPPPLRKAWSLAWSPSSLAPRRQRTCSQALLLIAFYCCFQPARNWLTGSDDKYRTLAGTRGPSSAASDTASHCLVAYTWRRLYSSTARDESKVVAVCFQHHHHHHQPPPIWGHYYPFSQIHK